MLFTVVTFLGFGVAAEHPASAQSDRPLTILVSPAKITAAYDVAEYVTVVVRPRSGSILRSADLQTAPVAGLNVRIVKQPSTADFPTANELIWLITIQSTPELCGDVSAVLTVNYTVEQNDDKKGKSFIKNSNLQKRLIQFQKYLGKITEIVGLQKNKIKCYKVKTKN